MKKDSTQFIAIENTEGTDKLAFHISYRQNPRMKDLGEITELIRHSFNETVRTRGISYKQANNMLLIDSIQPGSIEIIALIANIATIIGAAHDIYLLANELKENIKRKIASKKEAENAENYGGNRDVYVRNQTNVTLNPGEHDMPIITIDIDNAV